MDSKQRAQSLHFPAAAPKSFGAAQEIFWSYAENLESNKLIRDLPQVSGVRPQGAVAPQSGPINYFYFVG
jgi:hypothetical protein